MQSTPQPSSQPKKHTALRSLVFSAILLGAILAVWLNRQYIADSISFWQYQPTAEIEQLSEQSALTDAGRFTFYAAQPVVTTGEAYNAVCNAHHEERTAILGCYTANRIYVYDVTDPRLEGIKEVTATHEMLHAVYQRMSESEKSTINTKLDVEYEKLKLDPEYTERMKFYARTEPGQKHNELHSIIGTEIAMIDPALEAHYRKYFSDRQKIVSLYKAYSATFTALEETQKQLSLQLDELTKTIEAASSQYSADVSSLGSDIAEFNRRADTGGFSSPAEFNRERQQLLSRSSGLSLQRDEINKNVARYNQLKDQYNDALTQSNELYKSIDSSLSPAPKV